MCGIVGKFSPKQLVSKTDLEPAVSALHHRGPDHQEVWVDSTHEMGLGHARLSIIDLHTGDQPLFSQDKKIACVVNGEFYGFQTIRKELEAKGYRFATQSDSEILVHLYEEYGTQAVNHLRGEFSFIVWDSRTRTVFAGRDRFGIKPLFYSFSKGELFIASEAKALFKMGLQAKWNEEAFLQMSHLLTPREDQSLFQGIHQIPPGHFILSQPGQTSPRTFSYWDFSYPTEAKCLAEAPPFEEAKEEFLRLLKESIQLRLHADVPVGCYLSGGLDSCSVLGLASQMTSKKIHAFTLGFDHDEYNEGEIAREQAAKSGALFELIPLTADQMADSFSDSIWHSESPCINAHGVSKFLLSRAVQKAGYKVVLTGEGSDEILAGYPHFRGDWIQFHAARLGSGGTQTLLSQLFSTNRVSSGILLSDHSHPLKQSLNKILGYVPGWMKNNTAFYINLQQTLNPATQQLVQNSDQFQTFLDRIDTFRQLKGRHPVNQSMYLWSKSFLPNYILTTLGDRMEMAHSIEGRVPFLDHKLVEFVRTLPVDFKIAPGKLEEKLVEKHILREVAQPVLTKALYERQKHPFVSPPMLFNTETKFYQLMQDTLRSPSLQSIPFFDTEGVLGLLDRIPKMNVDEKRSYDTLFTFILSMCKMQEKFEIVSYT